MTSGCKSLCEELLEVQRRAWGIILPLRKFYTLSECTRQTCTDNTAGQDLINVMGCFSQLVPREFRRGSIALNPIDRMFPLPTYSHSYQWSISIRLRGSKFSLLFFITAGILQHGGVGRRKERTNAKYRCKLAPDSYNLHEPFFMLTNAGEISSLPSKAANSFRQVRVLFLGTAAMENKERGSLPEKKKKKRWERRRNA